MLAVVLALGSSVSYGVSNFLGPHLARRHTIHLVLVVSQLAALVGSTVLLATSGEALPGAHALLIGGLGGVGNAAGLIGFYKAAELAPVSVVVPFGAIGAAIAATYGVATGDPVSALQVAGTVLALGGAALAARRPPRDDEQDDPHPHFARGIGWALFSSLGFGGFLIALPEASADGRYWGLFDVRAAMFAIVLVWAVRRLGVGGALRPSRDTASLTVPGLLLLAGTLLYVLAAENGPLSLVAVLGSLFPVVTVALGVVLLGERLTRTQGVGVAAALVGTVFVAL